MHVEPVHRSGLWPDGRLFYWSATTDALNPFNAWFVDFYYGYVYGHAKDVTGYVRAVRPGL